MSVPFNMDAVMSSTTTAPVPVTPATIPTSPPTAGPKMDLTVRTPPKSPPRSCIICTEPSEDLVRPCRSCSSDYCGDCLVEMFAAATEDPSRMPPRCCNLLQIHTAALDVRLEDDYRAKFEEWITLNKTYCPSPACSAFIPERLLPLEEPKGATISLASILTQLVTAVSESPAARFFRGELPITELPGYTEVVLHPMDLGMIQSKVQALSYSSTTDLTKDMLLIVKNARLYNGPEHPIAKTADQMLEKYLSELSKRIDKLVLIASRANKGDPVICPKCHIAICVKCKQIEHSINPCDPSVQDHELAMLEQFRYKRCPLCKHAVKKMFGCPFMQCVCGAHWCYYCQRSIDECDGVCDEQAAMEDMEEEEEDEEEGYGDDDEDGLEQLAEMRRNLLASEAMARVNKAAAPAPPATTVPSAPDTTPLAPTQRLNTRVVDLDAGGARRWAGADEDFGDEPDEHKYQLWSCPHTFVTFTAPDDGYDHGDLDRMECNKCYNHVHTHPTKASASDIGVKLSMQRLEVCAAKLSKAWGGAGVPLDHEPGSGAACVKVTVAMECKWCRLLVCWPCQEKLRALKVED
ncbi:hypothetical protein B0A54_15825 [Friedmanniomyces endolithicus]|uniref:Bromo domain-containing protein n=1 Tax=Friedmanniomyces endolithicus TaxID=329885 RepID=A0A4U0U5U0_9PEZI|nr:hypothetical protein B0A54_15825 [Friedmanniomyces endolithicus]